MRRVFFILASVIVVGCTTTRVVTESEPMAVIKSIPETIKPEQDTSIFYYHVNPVNHAQSAAVVEGNFVWRDNCLYLIGSDRKFNTAMFPKLPKDIVKWDEAAKILNLNGRIFKMGDFISTNGQYSEYVPNSPIGIQYEEQGDKKCLTSTIVFIGTFFD